MPLYHCFGCVVGVLIGAAFGASCVMPSAAFSATETVRSIHNERFVVGQLFCESCPFIRLSLNLLESEEMVEIFNISKY